MIKERSQFIVGDERIELDLKHGITCGQSKINISPPSC